MQNVEQTAISNYNKNMEFLKKYHNETFHKIDILQNNISSARVKEKYALEFLEDGYFDIKELSSQRFLYADNSINISKQLSDNINFKKNSYSFEGFRLVHNYENAQLSDTAQSHEGIYPIMSFYLDNYPYETTMKQIEKFIFIGAGLGLHIEQIHKKIEAEHYIVIEDDLELFRLSLFTTPYYKFFAEKQVIFSIATNELDFNRDFNTFLETSFYLNRLIKYSYFPAHSDKKIQLIKNILASQNFLTFGYNTVLKKYLKPLDFINHNYKVINLSKQLQLNSLAKKPVLIIGAGPSLQKNIQWLKNNQDKFIIFAVATSLKLLYKHNIKPDIVSHIDGFQAGYKNFEGFDIQEFVKESIAILGSFVEQRVIDIFNKELTFMVEEDTFYCKDFSSVAAPCIGSTSVANALLLGFKDIYLLGIDLALSSEGETHSDEHESNNGKYDLDKHSTLLDNQISLRGDIFDVKGNFRDKVQTTPLFYSSIVSIDNSIKQLKSDIHTIYNLSDGAYIKNSLSTETKNIQNLSLIDKKETLIQLNKEMSKLSKKFLDIDDINSLKKRLSYTSEAEAIVKKYEKSVAYTDVNKYLYNLYGLVIALYPDETRENRNLTKVFDAFFQYTIPIIYDMSNTEEKKETINKNIQHVDKLIIKEMKNIIKQYKESIRKFLKERC